MTNETPQRRADDTRITELQADVASLKKELTANTEVTQQVRDILTSFRIMASVAKWLTAIAGAVAAGVALLKGVRS